MNEKTYDIFLSHSSGDKALADILGQEMEKELGVKVFVSSQATSIRSGTAWFNSVMSALEEAKVFVILSTELSLNSVWVSFEFGYFWRKFGKENMHILKLPQIMLPSPFDVLQAKNVTSLLELKVFFDDLCGDFDTSCKGVANLEAVVESAKNIPLPPPERSLARFEKYLENIPKWDQIDFNGINTWLYIDDVIYQIISEPKFDDNSMDAAFLNESWTKPFASANETYSYSLILKIAGIPIKEFIFATVDGGRYFVPLPQPEMRGENVHYFWNRKSLKFKIAQIVSTFEAGYMCTSLENFAKHTGIEIRG